MHFKTLITALLAVALTFSAGAQGRRPSAPPPVVSRTIAVQRGEKVVVPLGIHGARGEMLEFLIRTPPGHGKLSPVKNLGMNSATVTYAPSGKKSVDEDRFAYAVRGSEGVSAPGVITIRFVDPVVIPAKLKAPGELEFPPVFPGQRSTAELEIANVGGGFLEGEVAVSEPWSIEGLKIFKVAAGQRSAIRLVFTPKQPGERTGEAVISGTERKIILLRASAGERLSAAPAKLSLTSQPGSHTRMGVLKITNRTEEDANVAVEAGTRLMTDRMIKVPAHGTSAVPVFADAATGAAFDETVKLSSREWSATVAVHAVAVGPILKFTAGEVSIAGDTSGAAAGGSAVLENAGSEAVTVRLDVAQPFDVEPRVVTAPARGRVEIPITVRSTAAGNFRASLKASGEGGSATVPVKAEISEAVVAPGRPRTPAAPAESKQGGTPPADAGTEGALQQFPQEVREIPNALGRFAREAGTGSATLEWPASLGAAESARIEERVLSLSEDGDGLKVAWAPLAASITPAANRYTAELSGLRPGTLYTVRVVTGKDAETSVLFTTDFWTTARKPIFTSAMRTPLLVVALAALAFAVWRTRRTTRQARE